MIAITLIAGFFASASLHPVNGGGGTLSAIYVHGVLRCAIPYHASEPGEGNLTVEVLDPEDNVLGRTERHLAVSAGQSQWNETVKLDKPLAVEDVVWQRLRYRFEYEDHKPQIEGTESISAILRMPVVHIIAQQSYLSGGEAAVRVIVTDSQNQLISGPGSARVELLAEGQKPRLLFYGRLNRRGTTQAQFRFPAGLVGNYQLKYSVDTEIGSADFAQSVRLEDKASILLTTEKPIYQPGQTIHVRALALDRANHQSVADKRLVFELEDSRGNKVFKKITQTDKFGIAFAEFALADEVNLGTYHLRALMGEGESPTNTAELALNVQKYVLPKFKVAVEFDNGKGRHGYRPGDHVTGTVRANYFFGKPVDDAEVSVKASGMDVAIFDAGSVSGKTNREGEYHFDIKLANYFAGRPLSNGAARVLVEATVKDSASHSETRGEPITVSESPLVITAVPEGGSIVPNLENQVFILASYADGAPAKADLNVFYGGSDQRISTDDGGVGVVSLKAGSGDQNISVKARDRDG
ncbi:MAG TPA: MG2 domain-containing protein, partial [Chthoniobacterales bacterium]|nr:MG2 domain-containing protein [Chthoniobacterales bacterium]